MKKPVNWKRIKFLFIIACCSFLIFLFIGVLIDGTGLNERKFNLQKLINNNFKERGDIYSLEKVNYDLSLQDELVADLNVVLGEMQVCKKDILDRNHEYISNGQSDLLLSLLLRYLQKRKSLFDMVNFYSDNHGETQEITARGILLAMNGSLINHYYDSRFVALFLEDDEIKKLLNARWRSYDIGKNSYRKMFKRVTSPKRIELYKKNWQVYQSCLNTNYWAINRLLKKDERFAKLDRLFAGYRLDTNQQVGFILKETGFFIPELRNTVRHSWVADITVATKDELDGYVDSLRGVVYDGVGKLKNPIAKPVKFSAQQIADIKARLLPGDIILTYALGYMSNLFFPGKFKHGIIYVGSKKQRLDAGLTDEALMNSAVSNNQLKILRKRYMQDTTVNGRNVDVIEAVAEGVKYSSLENIMHTHVNRLVILRPKFSRDERVEFLLSAMKCIGIPYDFEFDFNEESNLCCTELLYRSLNNRGGIDMDLSCQHGHWVLTADDIVYYFFKNSGSKFEFILVADQDPNDKISNKAYVQFGENGEKYLQKIMAN